MSTLTFTGGNPFYLSQTFTFTPGQEIDFGIITLYSTQTYNSCFSGTCQWPSVPMGLQTIFGTIPSLQQLEVGITNFGALISCPQSAGNCAGPPSFSMLLDFIMPANQTAVTIFAYSWHQPTVIPPIETPLPGALSLFIGGLAMFAVICKRWRR